MKNLKIKALSISLGLSSIAFSQNKNALNSIAEEVFANTNGKTEYIGTGNRF